MALDSFHPLVRDWFESRLGQPTAPQVDGWRQIGAGRDTLIAAPTGSGKTLAAFLWALNDLVTAAVEGRLEDETSVIYISPLKALGNDIQKNLQQPLAEITKLAEQRGILFPTIRVMVRSGDTPTSERQAMTRHPPHILITTPESFFILLTADRSRKMLAHAKTVIVDEIHAVAGDKRGLHLALSLERLDALAKRHLQRIGLSATQKPIEDVARLLVGTDRIVLNGPPDCAIVDVGHRRALDLRVEVGDYDLGPIPSNDLYARIYDRIVALSREHRTTIVFVNTRRLVERVAHQLGQRLGDDKVAAHHGSLSRAIRLRAEEGLKNGTIPVVVATASLELGIDVGHVDLVCHLGSARAIATFLQRVGRSGHWLGATPKGILFPLTRDDLVQSAALVRAVRAGALDRLILPSNALDILAQQIVATLASDEMHEDDLWKLVHRAYPYRDLSREDYDAVIEMLSEGVATSRGRRSAHLHHDRVNRRLKARRGARLAAITSGGAIPDVADYDVIEEPADVFVGKVNEDFAIESMAGDIFLLGNKSWRIRRVEAGKMRVVDAEGAPPTIPFWVGEAPARTEELSAAVAELRNDVAARLDDRRGAADWVETECGTDRSGAEQIVAYVADALAMLGALPSQTTVIAERFFDEAGGMQLVVHAPFGGRINRAWGLALRKRFCRSFDFELQAAATDDGIVLSLGEQHSFPLESIFQLIRLATLEEDLTQALLVAPMFTNRWRWNATRSLALLRHQGGKRVPMPIQRMRAEDLLAAVFPQQVACQDNRPGGPIEIPDHPLVKETVGNCLHEAMDLDGLRQVLEAIENGSVRALAVDTPAPSPLSHEILNANPYAFLDDAPLEERRARAVSLRRVDSDLAGGIGALDPAAIDEVRAQAWPDVRDADELHDALLNFVILPPDAHRWHDLAEQLIAQRRATIGRWDGHQALIAAERLKLARTAIGDLAVEPQPGRVPESADVEPEEAVAAIVRGWMEHIGPTTSDALASKLGLLPLRVEAALASLENQGLVLRGHFTQAPAGESSEWCDRRLLARIHRLTIGRLRKEIEAVSAADFMRFLFRWQHVHPGTQLHGADGLRQIIAQLQGLELPAPAWEGDVLPMRVNLYNGDDLEHLCLSGEVAWGRLRLTALVASAESAGLRAVTKKRRVAPTRSAPLGFVLRESLATFLEPLTTAHSLEDGLSSGALEVLTFLQRRGAAFLNDIARGLGRLPTQTEEALWELVARGLVTGDGLAGLRTLLLPELERRQPRARLRSIRGGAARRSMPVGRWSLLPRDEDRAASDATRDTKSEVEVFAMQLLRRWGVVMRDLLARESRAPAWRDIVGCYRRMEARGEIRGGRFVAGFVGEQFALPEAVDTLRSVRRTAGADEIVIIAAADPLNLVGILTPGERLSPISGQVIAYRAGVPVAVDELGAVRSRLQLRKT